MQRLPLNASGVSRQPLLKAGRQGSSQTNIYALFKDEDILFAILDEHLVQFAGVCGQFPH